MGLPARADLSSIPRTTLNYPDRCSRTESAGGPSGRCRRVRGDPGLRGDIAWPDHRADTRLRRREPRRDARSSDGGDRPEARGPCRRFRSLSSGGRAYSRGSIGNEALCSRGRTCRHNSRLSDQCPRLRLLMQRRPSSSVTCVRSRIRSFTRWLPSTGGRLFFCPTIRGSQKALARFGTRTSGLPDGQLRSYHEAPLRRRLMLHPCCRCTVGGTKTLQNSSPRRSPGCAQKFACRMA